MNTIKNYKTSTKSIAAYLLMQGYSIENIEKTKNKYGKDSFVMEFNIDLQSGRDMAKAFFDGDVNGNLKRYSDSLMEIGNRLWKERNSSYEASTPNNG